MLIEYDGSNFYGFQKQNDVRTVQGELERVLTKFAGHKVDIITAGRTDRGVHALYQVVNFITNVDRPLNSWLRGLNALLSLDIVVNQVRLVASDFNARYHAIARTYHYYLYNHPIRPGMLYKKVGWYYAPLDTALMQEACQNLIGWHDFSSFRATGCQALTPVRQILHSSLTPINDKLLCFEITANAFLYHMVRNLVGTLIYIGNHRLSLDGLQKLLNEKSRLKAPPTFMPDGLYLANITYKTPIFDYAIANKFLI